MSAPLRILCLNYEYPPVGGGGGRVAHRINAGLVARGHAVRVQTAGLRHLPPHEIVEGVEIFRAQSFRRREDTCTVPEMALYLATALLPALRQVRAWRPHVIHAHFAVPTGALAWAVSVLTGTPYVLTAHLGDVPGGVPEQTAGLFRLVQPFTRPIWKRAAALTAVSTFVADLAERAYGRRPVVILNGVALGREPVIQVHIPPRLLFVGRLSVQKNPLLALRALARLRDIPWELRVIGDGPLRVEMENLVRFEQIETHVEFLGWRETDFVTAAMHDSDALLMSSHTEGLPMVAIEAIACGLAIFGPRIPGLRDVISENVNGITSHPNPAAMAAAMRPALMDPATLRALRSESWRRAHLFDIRECVANYEQILSRSAR